MMIFILQWMSMLKKHEIGEKKDKFLKGEKYFS